MCCSFLSLALAQWPFDKGIVQMMLFILAGELRLNCPVGQVVHIMAPKAAMKTVAAKCKGKGSSKPVHKTVPLTKKNVQKLSHMSLDEKIEKIKAEDICISVLCCNVCCSV